MYKKIIYTPFLCQKTPFFNGKSRTNAAFKQILPGYLAGRSSKTINKKHHKYTN